MNSSLVISVNQFIESAVVSFPNNSHFNSFTELYQIPGFDLIATKSILII